MNNNYYNYLFKNVLNHEKIKIKTLTKYNHLYLCAYSINTNSSKPFIRYLLSKNDNSYSFPFFDLSLIHTNLNKENEFIQELSIYLYNLCENNIQKNNIEYNGYYEYNNRLYIFFDISKLSLVFNHELNALSKHKQLVLMDEIINHKKIMDFDIDTETTNFFIYNHLSIYLYNEYNKPYETPIVAFVYKKTLSDLNFTSIFGENNKNFNILGPYYYFSDFQNTRQNMDKEINNQLINVNDFQYATTIYSSIQPTLYSGLNEMNYGVVRFALFMGKSKYIENFPNDKYDFSSIKEEKMSDTFLNKTYEILTQRISDHDGLWSINYDSVYLAKLELDDGNRLENAPLYVVKEFENQTPLSYHIISKNK